MPYTDVLMKNFKQLVNDKKIALVSPSRQRGQVSAENVAQLVMQQLAPMISAQFNELKQALESR